MPKPAFMSPLASASALEQRPREDALPPRGASCFEALVTQIEGEQIGLRPVHSEQNALKARVATLGYQPHLGDRVLVQRADGARGGAYIIGVLHPSALTLGSGSSALGDGASGALTTSGEVAGELTLSDGASGALTSSDEVAGELTLGGGSSSALTVSGEVDGALSLTSDASAEEPLKGWLESPSGDRAELRGSALELRGAQGELLVRFHTETRELELVSAGDLTLRAPGTLRLAAETIELNSTTTRSKAERLSLTAQEAEVAAGSLRLSAERVMSRAEEAYIEVERLLETRAARARLLVKSTLELFARRTSIRSEEDTRVDGKRVLLG